MSFMRFFTNPIAENSDENEELDIGFDNDSNESNDVAYGKFFNLNVPFEFDYPETENKTLKEIVKESIMNIQRDAERFGKNIVRVPQSILEYLNKDSNIGIMNVFVNEGTTYLNLFYFESPDKYCEFANNYTITESEDSKWIFFTIIENKKEE